MSAREGQERLEAALNGESEMTFYNPENKLAEWITSDTVEDIRP